jgi:cell division protein FtsB
MREFQDKRKIQRRLYSKVTIVALFILVALMAKGTWNVYVKAQDSRRNSELSEKEFETLQARHDFLKAQIESLNTTAGKEKEIRQNFQVSKEGEKLVVIVDSTSTVDTHVEEEGTMHKIWNGFLNIFR